MFSTFTGSSRRPRNVNLSGQTGNPFTNTSWSPSSASNSNKSVSDAQADRERRQTERQRLKAAGSIQRTWRGHRERQRLAELRRTSFDQLFDPRTHSLPSKRLPSAFNLLLSFFTARRNDDIQRLAAFVRDCRAVDVSEIPPPNAHSSRIPRFLHLLVETLNRVVPEAPDGAQEPFDMFELAARIITVYPGTVSDFLRARSHGNPYINTKIELEPHVYKAIAFQFLAAKDLHIFESNISRYSTIIDPHRLSSVILDCYTGNAGPDNDSLLWLLAHYIHFGSASGVGQHVLDYLEALYVQLAALSTEISIRLRQPAEQPPESASNDTRVTLLHPYVNQQLLSLVDADGISKLLRGLSHEAVTESASHMRQGTSLFAGYTSTLLICFPNQADDIRMRLFLTTIPTPEGELPTTKYLWNDVRQTVLFRKLVTESERAVDVLRNYVHGPPNSAKGTSEEREWRSIFMFLELYIFVLRLSDDDDFFSGMTPKLLDDGQPPSRIRACSLSLEDLKLLTTFLKNTAFALHYKAREITPRHLDLETSLVISRLDTYLGSGVQSSSSASTPSATELAGSTRLSLGSLKDLLTMAMKMLYERDSRKQFLPSGHWLMTDKLEREDFIAAVIAEDERQRQEDATDSDDDSDEDEVAPSDFFPGSRMGPRGGLVANSQATAYARVERMRQNQKRLQRERRLAEIGPKLEILKNMPFIVPFETRVKMFRQFITLDRVQRASRPGMEDRVIMSSFGPILAPAKHDANIRRGQLFEDAFENFYKIGDGLKDPISITFIDQFGTPEAGIDGGGVTKEFLTSVTAEAFSPGKDGIQMFTSSEKGLLYPEPAAVDQLREVLHSEGLTESEPQWREAMTTLLRHYEFLGRIVGKCLYEEILVNLSFAGFFLLQWPSTGPGQSSTYKGSVNDLRDMDEDLYKGMVRLKNYAGDVSDLGLDFSINDEISLPNQPVKTVTRNLVPNGENVPVTNDNRLLYISYVARHRLVNQPALQTSAFLRGLRQIIRPSWLSMFNQSELQRLVGGDSSEIDLEDLRRNTMYSGLYVIGDDNKEHRSIELFWKVMRGFTDQEKREVLRFVTSTPRAPLLGFSQLRPLFTIRDSVSGLDKLPTASTCVNLLKLPPYRTEEVMREKLLYAITSGAGFDLS
ncbi:ubiquitin-protein ligase E3 C [Geosmithia morbida]|uniref:HECT-type E3 ubiquitin transferase n=1 Tax=Geosmithia morbida TaxID=1094350 RepID=A0A9P5D6H5_9HYPO|nr:ubiquitin-protein ligase E3 C [Geosmithia morbida]KAF4125611.1 ubiquitin-protein ligase E3 C [Geosmithia morbida]